MPVETNDSGKHAKDIAGKEISDQEAASYLTDMLRSTYQIAVRHEFGFLSYLLEMSVTEADVLARKHSDKPK